MIVVVGKSMSVVYVSLEHSSFESIGASSRNTGLIYIEEVYYIGEKKIKLPAPLSWEIF